MNDYRLFQTRLVAIRSTYFTLEDHSRHYIYGIEAVTSPNKKGF